MFQKPSNLKILRDTLAEHMELSEYFLGLHAIFDGEIIFARNVIHVNFDLAPFPVDLENLWSWLREQLRVSAEQETFVYDLPFGVEDEVDSAMERLMELSRDSTMTLWAIDLAHEEAPPDGRRFVIVSVPDKKEAKGFRDNFHGKNAFIEVVELPS